MAIRDAVTKMLPEDDEIVPGEFSNLILDELELGELSPEDKTFLEEFTNMEMLSMNKTQLKSTVNFPESKQLLRLELTDNELTGKDLKIIADFY